MASTNANPDHDRVSGDPIRRDEFDDLELNGIRPDDGSEFVGAEEDDDDILGILRQA